MALVLVVRARVHDFHASLWLDGFVGALAAAALGAALVFGAVAGSGMDTTVVAVDLTYLLADLLLLAFVVGVFAVTGWRPGRSLLLLGAALAAGSVADGFFLYHAVTGTQLESTLMASLWPASALLAGFAAWQPAGGARSPRLGGARLVVVPIGFAALALGVQGYAALVAPVNRLALSLATAALLAAVVRMAASLRENSVLLERSRREALVDPLTGLDNRRKLMLDLRRATHDISEEIPHALMLFDLDGFKQYNDRYGHPAGDALLTRLGDRLAMAVEEGGRAYRLGGDEFCVLAQGAHGDLHELAEGARAALVEDEPGFARGRAAVAHQRYEDGFDQLKRVLDPGDVAYHPFVGSWALSDLVEAAAHLGKRDEAEANLAELESLAIATSGPFLLATLSYAKPLLAPDDEAEELYLAALGSGLENWPCYRTRMLLAYGRWLRRQRRVAESRAPLRAARESADALAFDGLAESARQELRASGESSPRRAPDARDQLTPQELQIGQLAAQGLSNRQIGQRLYLSHRTVGSHLYRMFPKLGITSRAQLGPALAPGGSSPR